MVRNAIFGESPVDLAARIAGIWAEVFPFHSAMITTPATESEPRNSDAFTDLESGDVCPERLDDSDHLVSGDDRILGLFQFPIQYMQVRTADTTDGDPDENLLFSGHWLLAIDQLQGKSGLFE
jgi:hypothetical protein